MKKILLIEDDTVLRETTAELLELSDFEVRTAADGKNGIQMAKEYMPDVIVCDIMMPEIDGYGVLSTLSQDKHTKSIPFIFLSAKTERKDVRKGMELGADDYLTKPFKETELIGAIESRLARMAILNDTEANAKNIKKRSGIKMETIHELKNYIDDNGSDYSFEIEENIYREGTYSNTVYLILKGTVKTHILDQKGKELITGIYKADDFFGFTSFTSNTLHKEHATAMTKVQLVGIPTIELEPLLRENHELTMELMQILSENLTEAKAQLLAMAYGSVRRKTAGTLLKFAEKLQKDSNGNILVLRSDLASVAGMATETMIRTLSSFKKEGLIDIENHRIRIVDVNGLDQVD
ncbi:response regulator [Arenibacter algicola]|jgi:CheY-like chemotaxis protein|uniref:Phosphate regulon transcriptional regulatory protein PhoB n=1 Tax=Arenibacter algicola TaxID=616991 RepID=A0A221UZ07_9FLAO|nr:response regulator [Arenibacter algicola]ASO06500.1 phosphate regulon transcriptional regulatory protein PhoB [Arenibacter algicola]MDX1767831.1 response regulator [Arenibacter troitsensis]|tara:strand:+ start:3138 stop:4190 length:1053 start_codon:yes stop_codon:yes gene_type:complete